MYYTFNCEACNKDFEVERPWYENAEPLSEPCPLCGESGKIFRVWGDNPIISGSGDDVHTQAKKKVGSDWGNLLDNIKKGSASSNTMFK